MTRATAQIVIYLDPNTNEYRAEMGSPNGARRKLELPNDPTLWGDTIGVELLELNTWLRDQEQRQQEQQVEAKKLAQELKVRELMALHRRVWDTTAGRDYGNIDSVGFANEKFGGRKSPQSWVPNVEKALNEED